VREAARENARAARAAERRRHEAVLELDARIAELGARARHDVGAAEAVRAVGRVPALVVGEDEQDVRPERLRVRDDAVDPRAHERQQAVAQRVASTVPPTAGIAAAHCGPTAGSTTPLTGSAATGIAHLIEQLVERAPRLQLGLVGVLPLMM
jgi:hypothetical protein